jgi:hypothetical protein
MKVLRSYEMLEDEIDEAVVRSGAGAGTGPGQSGVYHHDGTMGNTAESALLVSTRHIPSNPERRVRQAVQLAQKLLECEGQRDVLRGELHEAKERIVNLQQQLAATERSLEQTSQPQAYLIAKLRDEEAIRGDAVAKCELLEAEMARYAYEREERESEMDALRERLHSLLTQRSEIDGLRRMLEVMQIRQRDEDEAAERQHSALLAREDVEFEQQLVMEAEVERRQKMRDAALGAQTEQELLSTMKDLTSAVSKLSEPPQSAEETSPAPPFIAYPVSGESLSGLPSQPSAAETHPSLSKKSSAADLVAGLTPAMLSQLTQPPSSQKKTAWHKREIIDG